MLSMRLFLFGSSCFVKIFIRVNLMIRFSRFLSLFLTRFHVCVLYVLRSLSNGREVYLFTFLFEIVMSHFREYDYNEESGILIMYFYWDSHDQTPSLVIRLNMVSLLDVHIYKHRYCVSRLCICQELERLMLLLEEPHWKSFVSLTASRQNRVRNYELF